MTSAQSPFGASDTATRGLALIAIAVAIGALFLWKAYDGQTTIDAADAPVSSAIASSSSTVPVVTVTTADGGTIVVAPSTTLPAALPSDAHPATEVKVLVANATGQSGVAATITDALKANAYVTEPPGNAPTGPDSRVYYKLGYAEDAKLIATLLNASISIVEQAPASSPVAENAAERYESANVIVIVGSDGQVPFGAPAATTTTAAA